MLKYTILSVALLTLCGCSDMSPKAQTVTAEIDCDNNGNATYKVGWSCAL